MKYDWTRLARRWTGLNRSLHDKVLIAFVVLLAVMVAIALSDFEWTLALGSLGFLFLTAGWVGMYFQVKKTDPDHPVAKATYVGKWNTRNAVRLVGFHWKRHGMDLWTALLALGVGLLVMAVVRGVIEG